MKVRLYFANMIGFQAELELEMPVIFPGLVIEEILRGRRKQDLFTGTLKVEGCHYSHVTQTVTAFCSTAVFHRGVADELRQILAEEPDPNLPWKILS